jgi:hypothetical protein
MTHGWKAHGGEKGKPMKRLGKIILFATLIFLLTSCNSDSTVYGPPLNGYMPSDSARAHFLPEATDFAMLYLSSIRSPDTMLVSVPDSILSLFLYPLASLYDGQGDLPILDTLITQLGIRKNLIWSVGTNMSADTSEAWVRNVVSGISPTGNPTVDSLVALYDLRLEGDGFVVSGRTFLSVSHPPLNSQALARVFETVPGVYTARAGLVLYYGSSIDFELYSDASIIQFGLERSASYDRWSFSVNQDYQVAYLGTLDFMPPDRQTQAIAP